MLNTSCLGLPGSGMVHVSVLAGPGLGERDLDVPGFGAV